MSESWFKNAFGASKLQVRERSAVWVDLYYIKIVNHVADNYDMLFSRETYYHIKCPQLVTGMVLK